MSIANTAVWLYMNVIKKNSSHHIHKIFLPIVCTLSIGNIDVNWTCCGIHFVIYVNQTLNLYAVPLKLIHYDNYSLGQKDQAKTHSP